MDNNSNRPFYIELKNGRYLQTDSLPHLEMLVARIVQKQQSEGYSSWYIQKFTSHCRRLEKFMIKDKVVEYTEKVGDGFLKFKLDGANQKLSKDYRHAATKSIQWLTNFLANDEVPKTQPKIDRRKFKHLINFRNLVSRLMEHLRNQKYSTKTCVNFSVTYNKVAQYMSENEISNYDKMVGDTVLNLVMNDKILSKNSKSTARSALKYLNDFHDKGKTSHYAPPKRKYNFNGNCAAVIKEYIHYKENIEQISSIRLRLYKKFLEEFCAFCDNKGRQPSELSFADISSHFVLVTSEKKSVNYNRYAILKGLFQFLYDRKHLTVDVASRMPKQKALPRTKLPSVYSVEELNSLIQSTSQSAPRSTRTKAVVTIGSYLGIRASDIANLKFENIDWEKNLITLNQVKTKKMVQVPLQPDVGNSIIEYIMTFRPESDAEHIFLTVRPPHRKVRAGGVSQIVDRAFEKSSVETQGRKHGSHALRHSLGARMMDHNIPLNKLAAAFGITIGTSNFYTRVDLKAMRNCMLEVPPIPSIA